jgi:hypothetical protein
MIGAQAVMLPFDPKDHVATSSAPLFQVGGVVYLLGFFSLMTALIASYQWQQARAGRFGQFAKLAAMVGTMRLGGDHWFETFAVPWLADQAPGALDTEPTVLLALGAISSYLLFAIGWVLYGVASLRARVFPVAVSAGLVVGGIVGFSALLAPYGVPLGIALAALGVWMIRNPQRADEQSASPVAVEGVGNFVHA